MEKRRIIDRNGPWTPQAPPGESSILPGEGGASTLELDRAIVLTSVEIKQVAGGARRSSTGVGIMALR